MAEAQYACWCFSADDKVKATVAELTALSKNKDSGAVKVRMMPLHQTNANIGLFSFQQIVQHADSVTQLSTCCVVQGRACNMTKPAQVASLANFAHAELGSIDLW